MRRVLLVLWAFSVAVRMGLAQPAPFQPVEATIDDVRSALTSKRVTCRAQTYGSAVFKDFVPQREATVVTRLKKAGAVIVGKSTMGEFASGYVGSAFGVVRNAYDPKRIASGSSGGTGAGIAANFATVGIAEDTGGSTRGPAAVHSLVGLRPTVPLVSRFGMLPARPSTDTLGPIARSVRDAAMVLDTIAGYDPNDPVTAAAVAQVPGTYTQFLSVDGLKGARIGVVRDPLDPRADPTSADFRQVRAVVERALVDLKRLGAEIVDPLVIAEAATRSANLYDRNLYETEAAIDRYLADHPNAPAKTLREILLSGKVAPARARVLMGVLGRSNKELPYLELLLAREELRRDVLVEMAKTRLDALVYATFDHQPIVIPSDATTRTVLDSTGPGNNRRLNRVGEAATLLRDGSRQGMAEQVAAEMLTTAEIAANRWLPDSDLRVYTEEYGHTGFQAASMVMH